MLNISIFVNTQSYEYITDDSDNILAVNKSTGEIIETETAYCPKGSFICTPEQQKAYRQRKQNEQESYFRRKNNKPLGEFFFAPVDETFNGISPESVTRLIYLNTFTNYTSNCLMLTQRTPMRYKDLASVLNVSKATISRFWNEVCPKYLTKQEKDIIFTNNDVFKKGCLKRKKQYTNYQKFYVDGIRKLYNSTPTSNHKHLGYLFKLLPYINFEYNLICYNPTEKNLDNIELISIREFCKQINYDTTHLNRLLFIYQNICFDVDGNSERFCTIVYDGIEKHNAKIFINPHILYCGSNYETVKILGTFF